MFGVAIGCKGKQWMYLLFLVSLDLLLFFSPPFCYIFVRKGLAWNRRNLLRQVPALWTAKEMNGMLCRPNRPDIVSVKKKLLSWYNFELLRKIQWKAMFRAFINWQTEQWILQITYSRWLDTARTCPGIMVDRISKQYSQSSDQVENEWSAQKHRHSFKHMYSMGPNSSLWGSSWKHSQMQKFDIWSSRWQNANSPSLDPPNVFVT